MANAPILLGSVRIAPNKLDELNERIMTVLDKGGIRKLDTVNIGGKVVNVVKKVRPENGLLTFNYSVYEKKKKKECVYDTKTGKLTADECGEAEFGLIVIVLMCLIESYAEEQCYVTYDGKPLNSTTYYLQVLEGLVGEKVTLKKRERLWDMIKYYHFRDDVEDLTALDAMQAVPWGYVDRFDWNQIDVIWSMSPQLIPDSKHTNLDNLDYDNLDIAQLNRRQRYNLLIAAMERLMWRDEKIAVEYLREIMGCCMAERMMLSERGGDYGIIAVLSQYLLPHALAGALACVKHIQIWDAWHELGGVGYKDVFPHDPVDDKTLKTDPLPLFKACNRDYEDEWLEFCMDKNSLSDILKSHMNKWRQKYVQVQDIDPEKMESFLAALITDLNECWCCRYVDREFVDLMLTHKSNECYRRALVLMRDIMDDELDSYFRCVLSGKVDPIKNGLKSRHDNNIIMAYQSMIMNEHIRMQVLGF